MELDDFTHYNFFMKMRLQQYWLNAPGLQKEPHLQGLREGLQTLALRVLSAECGKLQEGKKIGDVKNDVMRVGSLASDGIDKIWMYQWQ